MSPDQHAQTKQLADHVLALRIDLSGMLGAGADPALIERAIWHLDHIVKLAEETTHKEKVNVTPQQ